MHFALMSVPQRGAGRGGSGRPFSQEIHKLSTKTLWNMELVESPTQSSLLNTFFRLSGLQSSVLLIYFRDGPNSWLHCTKVWHKTYPLCDAPLSRLVRRSFAPSQPFLCVNHLIKVKTCPDRLNQTQGHKILLKWVYLMSIWLLKSPYFTSVAGNRYHLTGKSEAKGVVILPLPLHHCSFVRVFTYSLRA